MTLYPRSQVVARGEDEFQGVRPANNARNLIKEFGLNVRLGRCMYSNNFYTNGKKAVEMV